MGFVKDNTALPVFVNARPPAGKLGELDASHLNDLWNAAGDLRAALPFVNVLSYGADPTGATDSTAAIQAAIDFAKTLVGAGSVNKGGCTVYLPAGIYSISSLNLSSATSIFYRGLRLQGAGRWATTLVSNATGKILIDMLGQNHAEIADMAIDSSPFQSQCAILLARSTTSTQCNNNRLVNLHVTGNYSKASVVVVGAESQRWERVRLENANTGANSQLLWSGLNNTMGVTSTNGTIQSPSAGTTDNVLLECEFYAPFDNAHLTVFHDASAYRCIGCTWVAGTQSNVRLITLQSDNLVFNGPLDLIGPHFEWFGTGAAIWLDGNNGNTLFKGLRIIGGYFNSNGGAFIDYDRTSITNQPDLVDATITSVRGAPGSPAYAIYLYALENSRIDWLTWDNSATLVVLGFVVDSIIKTINFTSAGTAVRFHVEQFASALPTTGTYMVGQIVWNTSPVSGGPLGWIATASGTLGTLNGNATTGSGTINTNTLTVSSATGLAVGQSIVIGGIGGPRTVTAISGTTVSLQTNLNATISGQGVFFQNATLIPFGTVGALAPTRTVLAYSATIATDASLGNSFSITATNGTAFTISNPTNLTTGQRLLYTIRNTSGGALGATTWGATFKVAAPTALTIATGNSLSIEFLYDGTNLIEIFRTPVVVPN